MTLVDRALLRTEEPVMKIAENSVPGSEVPADIDDRKVYFVPLDNIVIRVTAIDEAEAVIAAADLDHLRKEHFRLPLQQTIPDFAYHVPGGDKLKRNPEYARPAFVSSNTHAKSDHPTEVNVRRAMPTFQDSGELWKQPNLLSDVLVPHPDIVGSDVVGGPISLEALAKVLAHFDRHEILGFAEAG